MNVQSPQNPFDSNRAWNEAVELMKANRDLLLALAGVFVVLPAFALAIFWPPPQPAAGVSPEALLATMSEYYQQAAPALIGASLIHSAGTLAMLALMIHQSRPTVGEAIKLGFIRMPIVIVAQIILGTAVGAMLLVPILLGGAAGSAALAVLGVLAAIGLGIWAMVRLALIPPAVVAEPIANPMVALRRSWRLTEGNGARLLVFFLLILIAFLIAMLLLEGAVGTLFAIMFGSGPAMLASTLAATCAQAAMTVCFTAAIAASYRQLATGD